MTPIVFDTAGGVQTALCYRTEVNPVVSSTERGNGIGERQGALGIGDVQVLDHLPVDGDNTPTSKRA